MPQVPQNSYRYGLADDSNVINTCNYVFVSFEQFRLA